jgi:short-subunit dehydrogenase
VLINNAGFMTFADMLTVEDAVWDAAIQTSSPCLRAGRSRTHAQRIRSARQSKRGVLPELLRGDW